MEEIIAPISKELIKAELTEEKRLRMTNKSNNEIYIVTAQDSPNTMKETGRLREPQVVEQVCLWILTNSIPWKILINNSLFGIRKQKRYWVVIVTS